MPAEAKPSTFEPKSDLVRALVERGHIYQATDLEGLDAAAHKGPITAYIGFDATASSLHVGNLVQIMTLRRLQQTGHKPIVLMGGGTTKVGDPSDKSSQRPLLSDAEIAANIAGIKRAFLPFLTFGDGPIEAVMVNNADWLEALGYVEFLREFGVHFTVNRMLNLEFVRSRIESELPLTVLEFNYVLMQAVDFLELHRRFGCTLQFGGSEQWGNIVNGIDLVRRLDGAEAFGVTAPLVTTSAGVKMGKTVDGAVWLNGDLLNPEDPGKAPFKYWQFWRNTEDGDVGRFLRLFTDLPLDEIGRLVRLEGAEINEAKKVLASEATALLFGADSASAAAETAKAAFEDGRASDALAGLPAFGMSTTRFAQTSNAELMVAVGFASSNSDARRQIAGGGFRINGVKVEDANGPAAIGGAEAELRKGKTRVRLFLYSEEAKI
jgi:tyrosyl-tRNA synthetase